MSTNNTNALGNKAEGTIKENKKMKIKGILIKPLGNGTGEITEVEVNKNNLDDYYSLIECSLFDVVDIDSNNSIYVDDEGLIKTYFDENDNRIPPKYFTIKMNALRGSRTLAGNGLVLGINYKTGDSVDTTLSIKEIESMVTFEDKEFSKTYSFPNPQFISF